MSEDQPVACAVCGRTEPSPPLDWTSQVDERGSRWICVGCTRANVRAIEGRLDAMWW